MKKRKVSSFYGGVFVIGGVMLAMLTVFFVWILTHYQPDNPAEPHDWGYFLALLPVLTSAVGMCLSLYMIFKDMCSASYSVSVDGIYTYWHKETYHLAWDACTEIDIVQIPVNVGVSIALVYCATVPLTVDEKRKFLTYYRRDFEHVQYFQYEENAFREFLECLLGTFHEQIKGRAILMGLMDV